MTALQNVITAMEITGVDVKDKKIRALELLKSRIDRNRSKKECVTA